MSFLRVHGTTSFLGAAIGAASGLGSGYYHFVTPETFLNSNLPKIAEKIALLLGFDDLHDIAPWWSRDLQPYWMLPVTAVLLWLLTSSCRSRPADEAQALSGEEAESMKHLRLKMSEDVVERAELKTPTSKVFTILDEEAAKGKADAAITRQLAADIVAADNASAEYEAFAEESQLEWRLLRFEFVCSYIIGFLTIYLLGVYAILAVPLLALAIPIALFLVMVGSNVISTWVSFACSQLNLGDEEEQSGAAAWGVSFRAAAARTGAGVCDTLTHCFRGDPSAEQFWGVKLEKNSMY